MAYRQIDPEQSVSIVAILLFLNAAFLGVPLARFLLREPFVPLVLLPLAIVAVSVAAGVGLLKVRRWAWPLAMGAVIADILWSLLAGGVGGLFRVLFDALMVFLLTRPGVRERFGMR